MQIPKLKNAKCTLLSIVAVVSLLLHGCEGGVVGTGSGPSTEQYELRNLPQRISPDLPENVIRGGERSRPRESNNEHRDSSEKSSEKNTEDFLEKAQGWEELNFELNFVAFSRLIVEDNATFVDLVFQDIVTQCEQQPVDCTIPAGTLTVRMNQGVVNRLVKLYTDWINSAAPGFAGVNLGVDISQMIESRFAALLNTEISFGETRYSRLDGAPYDHVVRTSFNYDSVGRDHKVLVYWREDESVAKFRLDVNYLQYLVFSWDEEYFSEAADVDMNQFDADINYFYQNSAPGELVINNFSLQSELATSSYARVIGNNPQSAGILLDVVSTGTGESTSSSSTSSISSTSTIPVDSVEGDGTTVIVAEPTQPTNATTTVSNFRYSDSFQSQMDNDGGYASFRSSQFDANDDTKLIGFDNYRESFASNGDLLAGERCFFSLDFEFGNMQCNEGDYESYGPEGSSIVDSVHYFKPEDFDLLAAQQDAIRWQVEGLPLDIVEFAVLDADPSVELSEQVPLCIGFQVANNDVRLFCSATDEELANTVIVTLDGGGPLNVIPQASLVQIP